MIRYITYFIFNNKLLVVSDAISDKTNKKMDYNTMF